MPLYKIIFISFFIFFTQQIKALGSDDLLPADQAYLVTVRAVSAELIEVTWDIAEGYYLYRNKTSITSETVGIELGVPDMPAGKTKKDEFFGEVVVYRNQLKISIPIVNEQRLTSLKVAVKHQGCADIGVCYPPQKQVFTLNLPLTEKNSVSHSIDNLVSGFKEIKLNLFQDELLPAEQAFQFFATVKSPQTIHVNWLIADGYYLYRDKFKLLVSDNNSVQISSYIIPEGKPYHDEAFGQIQIFHNEVGFDLKLNRSEKTAQTLTLLAKFQGCADRGVCYPPMEKKIVLQLPATQQLSNQTESGALTQQLSEQDQIFQSLKSDSLFLTLLSFFGFGLLLAFTPCIFPMIPILSGIIVGQGESVTTRKAFLLSLSYVTASAFTYTIFGVLAALFGSNLQVIFQEPWVIAVFSGIFILLSLSMFGFYNLELPKSFQAKLHNSSDKHRDGSYIGAGVMGALSALIVGPCVAAPLAGALIYIGQTGDVFLGGSALFVMGFAMGTPLLLLGASAGSLLPKAGHWLNSTKAIFGVLMLAVSVWMLDRILPASLTMLFTASLLIVPAIYLRALEPLIDQATGWTKLWKGLGVIMLTYGAFILLGLSMGNTNPLQPLKGFGISGSVSGQEHGLTFKRIASISELDQVLEQASKNNQWVMFDFYADWCISCKEMEAFTFTDSQVKQKLSNFMLVQVDVTKNSVDDKALLKKFNLIGPPAILFFAPDKQERKASRVIGYQNTETFLAGINKLLTSL